MQYDIQGKLPEKAELKSKSTILQPVSDHLRPSITQTMNLNFNTRISRISNIGKGAVVQEEKKLNLQTSDT